ncbi:MAG: hypothetical protein GY867_05480 [bacterium]|nr:hypothetical protein [bacterium]
MPGEVHPTHDGYYELKKPKDWVKRVKPWLSGLLATLRYAALVGTAGVQGFASKEVWKACEDKLKAMERVAKLLPDHVADNELDYLSPSEYSTRITGHRKAVQQDPFGGMDLRLIEKLLEHIGAIPELGGLRRTISPEGDILWLCPDHYRVFDPGLPVLDDLQSSKKD